MQYRSLGTTGVQVSSLALGTMNFGRIGNTTQSDATAIVDAALAAGINLVDTADVYSGGQSEELLGAAIAGRRDDVVLATKAGLPMGRAATSGVPRAGGWSPPWRAACAGSASTTSTCTRSTGGTRRPVTRRRCPS